MCPFCPDGIREHFRPYQAHSSSELNSSPTQVFGNTGRAFFAITDFTLSHSGYVPCMGIPL